MIFPRLMGSQPAGSGAYAAGQNAGFILGFLRVFAGLYLLMKSKG